VLFEDETILRELPPLRAGWAKGGEQVVVPITGRNRLAPPSTPRLGGSSSKTGLTVGPPHFKHSCATCGGTLPLVDLVAGGLPGGQPPGEPVAGAEGGGGRESQLREHRGVDQAGAPLA
jgi:hypothetical protein